MTSTTPVPYALLEEAADWVITLCFGEPHASDRQAFAQWHARSPAHAAAWARAEAMHRSFEQVSSPLGMTTLQGIDHGSRRRTLARLGALLVAVPAGWLTWRTWHELAPPQWTADVATSKGERRTHTLGDGTELTLNGNSAADVVFTETERRVIVRAGEVLVVTHTDRTPAPRPFLVETPHGTAQALGTRFSVRLADGATRVAVIEHAVRIAPRSGQARLVHSGEQVRFDHATVLQSGAVDPNSYLWQNGMLVARNMRLADVIAELDRHRPGFLRCAASIADLRVSGALALDDVDASLATLAQRFPVRIRRLHPYWTVVEPLPTSATEKYSTKK